MALALGEIFEPMGSVRVTSLRIQLPLGAGIEHDELAVSQALVVQIIVQRRDIRS
jgi:hypothetical protein